MWWQSGEDENAEVLAEFADRIKAQRDTRLAGLRPGQCEYTRKFGSPGWRAGRLLASLLAEPGPPAR